MLEGECQGRSRGFGGESVPPSTPALGSARPNSELNTVYSDSTGNLLEFAFGVMKTSLPQCGTPPTRECRFPPDLVRAGDASPPESPPSALRCAYKK